MVCLAASASVTWRSLEMIPGILEMIPGILADTLLSWFTPSPQIQVPNPVGRLF